MKLPLFLGLGSLLVLGAACGATVTTGIGGGTTTGVTTGAGGSGGGTTTSAPTFDACATPVDCVIVGNGCCDPCGPPGLANVAAVSTSQQDAFHAAVCPAPIPCPKCGTAPNPNLFATCEAGHCKANDLTTSAASACSTDSQCQLRFGTSCCGECSGESWDLVAVAAGFEALVCSDDIACPKCAPQFPPEASAVCLNGHCAVQGL